ncbi:MAG: NAD(P)-binding domain-containing protein, partial [Acetatifactor sp.]|nr:NAD(P)-binding domain-containing protein [Acetatifactor sp.]
MKIGFIGLGNMAEAMIGGMLGKGTVASEDIIGSARTAATRDRIRE